MSARFRGLTTAAALLTATFAAVGLAGCGTSQPAAATVDLSTVTVRVADQVKSTRSLVEASKALDGAPYHVEWSDFQAAAPQLEALRADAADVAGAGGSPTLNAIAAGAPLKAVAALQSAGKALAIVVPKDSPIKTLADLKGKNISPTTKGSVGHWLVLEALKKAGIAESEVTLSYLLPSDAQAAFTSGRIDAWAVWDPFVALTEAAGARILVDSTGLAEGYGVVVTTNSALADPGRRAAVADFVGRLKKAYEWRVANPVEAVALYSTLTKLPQPISQAVYDRGPSAVVPITDAVVSNWQGVADLFASEGVYPRTIDAAASVDRTVVGF